MIASYDRLRCPRPVFGVVAVALGVLTSTLDGDGLTQAHAAGAGVGSACYASLAYPGDATPAAVARWMAASARAAGLPPELPVMASLVESGMKNLKGGDADSVGFFQMRVGVWNKGEYAGYPDKPELQIKWFLDQAIMVKQQRFEKGDSELVRRSAGWGEWIADVKRPAPQLRGRYQARLDEARKLIAAR
jgi:hypothetical protein